LPRERHQTEQRRRPRQPVDEPRLRDLLHPGAGERDQLTAEEQPVVAVAERAEEVGHTPDASTIFAQAYRSGAKPRLARRSATLTLASVGRIMAVWPGCWRKPPFGSRRCCRWSSSSPAPRRARRRDRATIACRRASGAASTWPSPSPTPAGISSSTARTAISISR